jgi:kynurenine formamidase
VVTRGILLDVAAQRGRSLGAGEVVGLDDLRAAAAAAGASPETGDVVLVRTGWWGTQAGTQEDYFEGEPGLDVDAARWLAEAGVAAVGADNYAIEVLPFISEAVFPVHQLLMRDFGVPLIEGMVLDELAEAGAAEFLLVVAPLPVVGGTAGPVCPVAVL